MEELITKILISYFSQGGSTARISGQIAQVLKDRKCHVDLNNIEENRPVDVTSYDAIGIGCPVYIYRLPFPVIDYIRALPALQGKPFFVFLLHGTHTGTAGNVARKMLARKGGREIGYSKYRGADNFLGYLKRGYLFSPDSPGKNDLDEAYKFGQKLIPFPVENDYTPPPFEPGPGLVYTMERIATMRFLGKYFYRYFYRVDKKKCDGCNICVKKCPAHNITLSDKGYPRWGGSCINCWYCELSCPREAITSPLDWTLMSPFFRYNVANALKNPGIEKVAVTLSKGKIKRK